MKRVKLVSISCFLIFIEEFLINLKTSPGFLVLLCTHYGPWQCFSTYFRKLREIGVLRPIFSDHVISCDYDMSITNLHLAFVIRQLRYFEFKSITVKLSKHIYSIISIILFETILQ